MGAATQQGAAHVEDRGLADPIRQVALDGEADRMWRQVDRSGLRYTATCVAKLPGLRVVLITLREGECIPEHRADADISLLVVRGAVEVDVAGAELTLRDNQVATVGRGLPHDVYALEDSELLLTLGASGS